MIVKTEEEWEKFCVGLMTDIDSLCNHDTTKEDLYDNIKEQCRRYMLQKVG